MVKFDEPSKSHWSSPHHPIVGGRSPIPHSLIPSSAIGNSTPKINPLGVFPKKIDEDITKETAKDWKGLRVTVKLTIQNR
ncbi:hypothetical protein L1049_004633 [Liquidambar formosana]|uniref:Large ribosomal subunit protein uL11 N-terminal domain-containing protein n=1 Tax=Liquidambar formosana TaxID=63359 RepID=A0AAP0RNH8_LIQFO